MSASLPNYIQARIGGSALLVWAIPGSSRTMIVGPYNNRLKIKLSNPASKGVANDQLREFLAEHLNCSPRQIFIIQGEQSQKKTLFIAGVSAKDVASQLP